MQCFKRGEGGKRKLTRKSTNKKGKFSSAEISKSESRNWMQTVTKKIKAGFPKAECRDEKIISVALAIQPLCHLPLLLSLLWQNRKCVQSISGKPATELPGSTASKSKQQQPLPTYISISKCIYTWLSGQAKISLSYHWKEGRLFFPNRVGSE